MMVEHLSYYKEVMLLQSLEAWMPVYLNELLLTNNNSRTSIQDCHRHKLMITLRVFITTGKVRSSGITIKETGLNILDTCNRESGSPPNRTDGTIKTSNFTMDSIYPR